MPNDLTLYPSISNPQQRQIERTAGLEARVAALEAKRDIVFTPMTSLTSLVSFTLPYFGGRMWAVLATDGSFNGTGSFNVTNTLLFNGAALPGGNSVFTVSGYANTYAVASDTNVIAIPSSSLNLGNNTLTMTFSGGTTGAFSGLFVEWPQA